DTSPTKVTRLKTSIKQSFAPSTKGQQGGACMPDPVLFADSQNVEQLLVAQLNLTKHELILVPGLQKLRTTNPGSAAAECLKALLHIAAYCRDKPYTAYQDLFTISSLHAHCLLFPVLFDKRSQTVNRLHGILTVGRIADLDTILLLKQHDNLKCINRIKSQSLTKQWCRRINVSRCYIFKIKLLNQLPLQLFT